MVSLQALHGVREDVGFAPVPAGYLREEPGTFVVVGPVLAVRLPTTPVPSAAAPVAPTEMRGFKTCQLPVLWVFWW